MDGDGRPAVSRWWLLGVGVIATIFIGAVVGTLAMRFMFDASKIPTEAMTPSVGPGDRILARHISGHAVRRRDIVLFRGAMPSFSAGGGGTVRTVEGVRISRVIAVGGDRIDTRAGHVRINGHPIAEPYLAARTVTDRLTPIQVPTDTVYLMGDNRGAARDSRAEGPVFMTNIVGRVDYVNVPLDWITLGIAAASGLALAILLARPARRRRRLESLSRLPQENG